MHLTRKFRKSEKNSRTEVVTKSPLALLVKTHLKANAKTEDVLQWIDDADTDDIEEVKQKIEGGEK